MLQTIAATLLTIIGVLTYPIFTLGCVLIHYNHPILGILIIIYSVCKDGDDEVEYID